MADTANQRAADLRNKVAQAKLDRLKNSGNGLFDAPPSKRAQLEEDKAVYNKLQNLREEEAEALEKRGSGMKKGGSVRGWGKARGARKAKVY